MNTIVTDRSSFSGFDDVQSILSQTQAIPIVGMLFSPVKAVVSVAQIISGFAAGVIFGSMSLLLFDSVFANKSLRAFETGVVGIGHLAYSVINFVSLGIIGTIAEHQEAITRGLREVGYFLGCTLFVIGFFGVCLNPPVAHINPFSGTLMR